MIIPFYSDIYPEHKKKERSVLCKETDVLCYRCTKRNTIRIAFDFIHSVIVMDPTGVNWFLLIVDKISQFGTAQLNLIKRNH